MAIPASGLRSLRVREDRNPCAILEYLPAGRCYRREMYRRQAALPPMPVMRPQLTLRQVRAQAAAALPGSRVRWLVRWRYEPTWRKPGL